MYMVNEDILMVLFYNCSSTALNYSAQTYLDYEELGIVGALSKDETENRDILNITAFDCLTSSIFQMLLLYCIYSKCMLV